MLVGEEGRKVVKAQLLQNLTAWLRSLNIFPVGHEQYSLLHINFVFLPPLECKLHLAGIYVYFVH